VDGYKDFLWQMSEGEIYTEIFLIKKMTLSGFNMAVDEGLIKYVDTNDIGIQRYTITKKGILNRK